MNRKSSRIIRFVVYITSSIVLMLFLVFLSTYDFTNNNDYSMSKDNKSYFGEKITDSIENINKYNYLTIDISEDELESYLIQILDSYNKGEKLYEGLRWTLKGVRVKFVNHNILLDLKTSYHGFINYELKIGLAISVSEEEDYYRFIINNISFGILSIPSSLINKTLSDKSDGSIGEIIQELTDLLQIENDNNYSNLRISKDFLLNTSKDELIKELGVNSDSFDVFELYYKAILDTNKTNTLKIDETINLTFNVNKLVNAYDNSINSKINNIKNSTYSTDYIDNAFKVLIGDKAKLSNNEFNDYVLYINKEGYAYNVFDINFSEAYISGDNLIINLYVGLKNRCSIISYAFKNDNGFIVDKINVGFSFTKESYQVNSNVYNGYLNILNNYIDISVFDHVYNNEVYISENNVSTKILDGLLSDDFYSNLGFNFSHNDKSDVINSFESLSLENKKAFLIYLKDTFKEDLKVYNYIVSILR